MELVGTPINILLVDDNAPNLTALETLLEAPDRNLVKVSSGGEALRYLLEQDVAVILLDVQMPIINGLETAELIRARDRSKNVPIIFLTAHDSGGSSHISKGYSLGAVDFFIKPFDPIALKAKVTAFVELFRKTLHVEKEARLLREQNLAIEVANLRRLTKLVDLGHRIAAEREPESLLRTFCDAARDVVGARYAAVGVAGDGPELRHFFMSASESFAASSDDGQRSHDPALKADRLQQYCSRAVEEGARPINIVPYQGPFSAVLGVPIPLPDSSAAWLFLADKLDQKGFSESDEQLAVTLGARVALAYQNVWLYLEAQKHAIELEQEVAERRRSEEQRAELFKREQEARAEAETANRLKDEFLAIVSHELRTPLNALMGWTHLLRWGALTPEQTTHAVETIERNARVQHRLIEDLLDVSRIATGKLDLDLQKVDVLSLVRGSVEAARPMADGKGVVLETDLDEAVARIPGDSNRLQQVMWNLLSNAIKFTPQHGHVMVRLRGVGSTVEIRVEDSGQGISPDFLPYVFDRFRQGSSGTSRKHGGLGLGLAIARHLVELHGGVIRAESQGTGQGSNFVVLLPIVEGPRSLTAPSQSVVKEDLSHLMDSLPSLDGINILVVDDEADARDMIKAFLTRQQASVVAVTSVAEGLAALDAGHFDVILSDIEMPEEDGFGLMRRLAKRPQSPPVVALTAHARANDRNRALRAGFRTHLTKPIEPAELVAVVASLSGRFGRTGDGEVD